MVFFKVDSKKKKSKPSPFNIKSIHEKLTDNIILNERFFSKSRDYIRMSILSSIQNYARGSNQGN